MYGEGDRKLNIIEEREFRIQKASERLTKARTKDNMYNGLQLQEVFAAAKDLKDANRWGRK